MPTGYTADILDGKVTTGSEFAQLCARAFMLNMRDKRVGEPLTMPEHYGDYYTKALPEDLARLAEWDAITEEEKYAKWSDEVNDRAAEAEVRKAEAHENFLVLDRVLMDIEAIEVPETHANFKKFMIEQIESTIDADATFKPEWYEVPDYVTWVTTKRQNITRMIEIHAEGLAKAEKNYVEGTKWVNTMASLFGLNIKD